MRASNDSIMHGICKHSWKKHSSFMTSSFWMPRSWYLRDSQEEYLRVSNNESKYRLFYRALLQKRYSEYMMSGISHMTNSEYIMNMNVKKAFVMSFAHVWQKTNAFFMNVKKSFSFIIYSLFVMCIINERHILTIRHVWNATLFHECEKGVCLLSHVCERHVTHMKESWFYHHSTPPSYGSWFYHHSTPPSYRRISVYLQYDYILSHVCERHVTHNPYEGGVEWW